MKEPIRIIWQCDYCNDIVLSYSNLRQINTCDCGESSVDFNGYYQRCTGKVTNLSKKKKVGQKWVPVVTNTVKSVPSIMEQKVFDMLKLTEEQKKKLDTYPKVEISKDEFDKLPEYSMTNPTQSGNIGIKRWKHRTPVRAKDDEAIWFLGEVKEGMYVFSYISNII